MSQVFDLFSQLSEDFTRLDYTFKKKSDLVLDLEKSLSRIVVELEDRKKADKVFESLINESYSSSLGTIKDLISRGLRTIFDIPFQFEIKTVTKRGNLSYEMYLIEDGKERSIIDSYGGGVVSVISILLRIVTILIVQPPMRRVLFLDESLAQLSKQYVPNAAKFFKELGAELGFKILMISHDPTFIDYADKVYQISKEGPYAKIEEIEK